MPGSVVEPFAHVYSLPTQNTALSNHSRLRWPSFSAITESTPYPLTGHNLLTRTQSTTYNSKLRCLSCTTIMKGTVGHDTILPTIPTFDTYRWVRSQGAVSHDIILPNKHMIETDRWGRGKRAVGLGS